MSRGRHLATRAGSRGRRWLPMAWALLLTMAMAMPAIAGPGNGNAPNNAPDGTGTVHGTAQDPSFSQLGEIKYLFNKAGYHFWFSPTANLRPYVAGNEYHNVYKYEVDDPENWCPEPTIIPNRLPYNAGGTDGQSAYYKIWNVTTETWVCGSE